MNVPSEASAFERNQRGRNEGGYIGVEGNRVPLAENYNPEAYGNARDVDMNVNDNIENGIGIENNPVLTAAAALGTGAAAGGFAGNAAGEGIDWFNMGRWGESLGQSVQELPENLRGMLGWLIPGGIRNPGEGGGGEEGEGSNEEHFYPQTPNWPITIPRQREGQY